MKKFLAYNLSFTLTGILTLIFLITLFSAPIKAVDYTETARGVDVYLVTDSTTVDTQNYFNVDIVITNDGTPLNAMEAEVNFDPKLFTVANFTFGNSICEERFVIDTLIDNESGRLHMSCGTIEPFTGNATVFGTMTVIPNQAGISNLEFGPQTHVHIHDGLGTEIVRDVYGATVVVQSEV